MKVRFLGTGTSQGVPVIGCQCAVCQSENQKDKRLRSSVFVETSKVSLVIDTGPDFRQQMLTMQATKLDAVLFTHGHKDHTAGFDDIRAFNYIQQRDMPVYGDHLVKEVLHRDFYYCFEEHKYPGVPQVDLHIIDDKEFEILGEKITPIKLLHYKLPVLGFRIQDFTYITDANYISEEEKEKIRGSKVLVLNALRKSDHISHFNLNQAVALSKELEVEQTYFTHMSHQMGKHVEVNSELPANIQLAFDTLTVEW